MIRVGYPKNGMAVWWIEVEAEGDAYSDLKECTDEDAKIYSDVFTIDAEIESYCVLDRKYAERK